LFLLPNKTCRLGALPALSQATEQTVLSTEDAVSEVLSEGTQNVWTQTRGQFAEIAQRSAIPASDGAWAPVIAEIAQHGPVLAVTATSRQAQDLTEQLQIWTKGTCAYFPPWETLPHERLSPSAEIVGARLEVLDRVLRPDATDPRWGPLSVVVAPVRALMQPLAPGITEVSPVVLARSGTLNLAEVTRQLAELGYERCDLVERRGQYAVRGGILDVFPPGEEHPVRAELFGDEIEDLRTFAVADQRMMTPLTRAVRCLPCQEVLLTPRVRERAAELARELNAHPDFASLAEGIAVPGMESLAPMLLGNLDSPADYLCRATQVVLVEPSRLTARAEETMATADEFAAAAWATAGSGGEAPITPADGSLQPWPELLLAMEGKADRVRELGSYLPYSAPEANPDAQRGNLAEALTARPVGPFTGPTEAFATVSAAVGQGWRVLVAAGGRGSAARLAEVMRDRDIPARVTDAADQGTGFVQIAVGPVSAGFRLTGKQLAVLTGEDFVRSSKRSQRKSASGALPSKRRRQIDPLSLRPGDCVVHEKHGIGRFIELIHRESRGAMREFLVVEYAPSKRGYPPDRLFIPSDQLQSVTKYVGGEQPGLSKLGGSDWARAKGSARKAVKEIAGELVRLYAARQSAVGFAFGPDTVWQNELEDAFEHVETVDQLSAINEVKADMQSTVPMDRLICGDVGYGKTEIAVRAAFKAIQDGKQVALLVPTTLLATQHLTTFIERFANFPVRVAGLSRFQSAKEANNVIEGLATGKVDLVIGTHRMLTTQVRFAHLGLVIVDEEQRFGVEHKEHLKALRANVDMLAMSATPIPRTLEMAVTGIREMSTIATPPEERLSILTYVGAYEEKQVRAAIQRELLRDGQVFFVHNRVSSIQATARRISELVPQARVEVAHGQMPESTLEKVVLDFWEGNVDVLVTTTIIESGIDIANANTLIVDRADAMGLSQLHQLRGRVGRSSSRAYAYFLHSPDKILSETAHDRLTTIAQNSDLGSGMQVAMKDLEIRGAGNLLGGEQSGHIADVGFDLYVRMVGEALAEHKGETSAPKSDVRVDLPIDAHIPAGYVPEERLRLEAYQRLAGATSPEQIQDVVVELTDRYGPPPASVANLVAVAKFRLLAQQAGLTEVVQAGSRVRLHPLELPESRRIRLTRLYKGAVVKPATRQVLVPLPSDESITGSGTDLLHWVGRLIKTVVLDNQ
jgi:transcription-repair coupling factor (superfamily II helicase)